MARPRIPPTASARRQRAEMHAQLQEGQLHAPGPEIEAAPEAPEVEIQAPEAEPQAAAPAPAPAAPGPYPGGPEDLTLLIGYQDHEASYVWRNEGRQKELKTVSHGKKLLEFLPPSAYIRQVLDTSGLGPIVHCCYRNVDKGLLSAFCERWHRETSSFHLPVGEMTITLDDVACLTHLPIHGEFFSPTALSSDDAPDVLVEMLGMTQAEAVMEVKVARGPSIRFSTLKTIVQEATASGNEEHAARAYMLFVLGTTIFADKSWVSVDVNFLGLLTELDQLDRYAWGAMALAYLYDYLADASKHKCRQFGGFSGLLQAWIFEHFLTIGSRREKGSYVQGQPRAAKWEVVRGSGQVEPVRSMLDRMTADDVSWTPYSADRDHHPFHPQALFSGCIRVGSSVRPYLPERVLRQFGYIQDIPRSPCRIQPVEDVDEKWAEWEAHVIDADALTLVGASPGECVPGFMRWFLRVSHPYMSPEAYARYAPQHMAEVEDEEEAEQPQPAEEEALDPEVGEWRDVADLAESMVRESTSAHPFHARLVQILTIARGHARLPARDTYRRQRRRTDAGPS